MTKIRCFVVASLVVLFVGCFTSVGAAQVQLPPARPVPVPSPDARSDTTSYLIGQNFRIVTDRILEQPLNHYNQVFPCDFAYDGRNRKVCMRSLNITDVNDPGDIRFVRFPGGDNSYPNNPDRGGRLHGNALVGQIGSSEVNTDGSVTAYEVAVQFYSLADGTGRGYLCFGTATGKGGITRNGYEYPSDQTICHVVLLPSGAMVIGADSDPRQLPSRSLVVLGNAKVDGCLEIGGQIYGKCLE